METIIQVQIKQVYGRELIYPFNSQADKLATLIGKKTFNVDDILHIRALGFSVRYMPSFYKLGI